MYLVPDRYVPGLHPPQKIEQNAQHTLRERHTRTARHTMHSNVRVTTAASETEGVAAVSWIESLMIDPNSIRETDLHTESRRRHSRGERKSVHSPQLDREREAARQRAAAARRRETDEARAERCVCDCLPPELTNGTHTRNNRRHVKLHSQGISTRTHSTWHEHTRAR